jgi:ACS family D-galactonate transporter-like MFS transporter
MVTPRQVRLGRGRFFMLGLIFVCVVINYMDRTTVSVAANALAKDFALTSVQLGKVFSAFGWTYAAFQIPGGLLADVLTPRLLYALSLLGWSLATLSQALAGGFGSLVGLRMTIGACEAPAYPVNSRIVTRWFPVQERASSVAIYTSGQYVGLAFLTPAMAALQVYAGWRALFVITGLLGVAWTAVWYALYRDPGVRAGAAGTETGSVGPGLPSIERKGDALEVFRHGSLWGVYLGQFAITSAQWFFLTWFPIYLEKYRGIVFIKAGIWASIPFLAAFVGVLFSGLLSDFLFRRGVSTAVSRKAPVIVGLLLTTSIVGANYVERPALIILFLAVAFFGNGMASITWVFITLMAPAGLIGLAGGVFNFCGNLSAIVVPLAIGYLVRGGDFAPALLFVGSLALFGVACYVFLVRTVRPVDAPA